MFLVGKHHISAGGTTRNHGYPSYFLLWYSLSSKSSRLTQICSRFVYSPVNQNGSAPVHCTHTAQAVRVQCMGADMCKKGVVRFDLLDCLGIFVGHAGI